MRSNPPHHGHSHSASNGRNFPYPSHTSENETHEREPLLFNRSNENNKNSKENNNNNINNRLSFSRDLSKARDAFLNNDAVQSRAAHSKYAAKRSQSRSNSKSVAQSQNVNLGLNGKVKSYEEGHQKEGEYIKSVVFGGLDGILTTFAIVAGAVGGGMSLEVILVVGFSSKFADALAMGLGDALSTKAEHEHILLERQREYWEYDTYPEGEINEMVEMYVAKGMKRKDAEKIIGIMAQHRDFFVDVMMVEELGLQVPDADDNPWKDGFVTFVSFIFFGFFPLLTYCTLPFAFPSLAPGNSKNEGNENSEFILFGIATLCSVLTLFALGTVKSLFSIKKWWRCGLEMVFIGTVIALIAYFVGALTKMWLVHRGVDLSQIKDMTL